jgi:hypothetical protein
MEEQKKPKETQTAAVSGTKPVPPGVTGIPLLTWKWHATVLAVITAFLVLFYICILVFLPAHN